MLRLLELLARQYRARDLRLCHKHCEAQWDAHRLGLLQHRKRTSALAVPEDARRWATTVSLEAALARPKIWKC